MPTSHTTVRTVRYTAVQKFYEITFVKDFKPCSCQYWLLKARCKIGLFDRCQYPLRELAFLLLPLPKFLVL